MLIVSVRDQGQYKGPLGGGGGWHLLHTVTFLVILVHLRYMDPGETKKGGKTE